MSLLLVFLACMHALCSPYFTSPVLVVLSLPSCVAAVLVEKILRVQPDVKRIYLPVRAPDAESAKKRVETEVMTYFVMHFYIHSMISDTVFCSSVPELLIISLFGVLFFTYFQVTTH